MLQITGFKDVEDLKYKVASHPDVIYNLACLAHMMGFAWCGGTQTGLVGSGFDVSKRGNDYIIQGHYDPNDPHAEGFWRDKTLNITLSNFRILFDPATFSYGRPLISNMDPLAISSFTAINRSPSDDTVTKAFTYQLSNTVTHTTNYSFTEGLKITIKNKASIPFFGESEVSTEFSFSATQGWSNATTTMYGSTDTQQYTGKIPASSRRLIKLMVLSTQSQINYTTQATIAFDVSFTTFLRWSGNARIDHPDDRPFVTARFGSDGLSAFEDIVDKYDHKSIPKYWDFDWEWMRSQFGGLVDSALEVFRGGIGVTMSGRFTNVKGVNANIEAENAQSLTDASRGMAVGMAVGAAAQFVSETSPLLQVAPQHLILQSDEETGGRVISIA